MSNKPKQQEDDSDRKDDVGETFELFVPGRICLFGEHSDWAGGYRTVDSSAESTSNVGESAERIDENNNGAEIPKGLCLIVGTDQGLYARAKKRAHDRKLILRCTLETSTNNTTETEEEVFRSAEFDMQNMASLLEEAQSTTSEWAYICGVVYQLLQRYNNQRNRNRNKNRNNKNNNDEDDEADDMRIRGGLELDNYRTTLPVKKGLSSSAAICVLTARAFSLAYDLRLTRREEMELAYVGERTTASECGRMDQGCAFGPGKPILMEFDGDDVTVRDDVMIGAAGAGAGAGGAGAADTDAECHPIHLLLVDLRASKDTRAILHDLRLAYPIARNDVHRGVQKLFGETNHSIMAQALEALANGDAERVGRLMTTAQSKFDEYAIPASPEHLRSPVLHRLLTWTPLQSHVYGGKGVGSQGDGSAQFVAKSKMDRDLAMKLIETELGMSCLPLTLGGGGGEGDGSGGGGER